MTVLVAARAEVRAFASRVMAEACGVWLALPGLWGWGVSWGLFGGVGQGDEVEGVDVGWLGAYWKL